MLEIDEIKNDLAQFKYNCAKLLECEEELELIATRLYSIGSPTIQSKEEAKYQKGTKIYHNNIAEIMLQEEEIKVERDYFLLKVKRVGKWLTSLTDEEVRLLHYRYYDKLTIRIISKLLFKSKSSIIRELDDIISKIQAF